DTLSQLSGLARQVAPILGVASAGAQIPLQLAGLSEAARGRRALESGVRTQQAAAAPAIAAEQQLFPVGTAALLGQPLPPQLEAAIQAQVNQARQTRLQQLVSAGTDPATAQAMVETEMQQ